LCRNPFRNSVRNRIANPLNRRLPKPDCGTRRSGERDTDYEVLLTVEPVRIGDLQRVGGRLLRVVRIVPGGALVRPRRWYDPVAIVLHRLGLV
jgi:hypothetical protein